ncbi:TRAP transporter substrate-binding protein [Treponema pectinovorum]|uniref:TRAP transporter substrate-binding protein n=1 Tax=Treponema pectinovorum TaxID=164 RepID=UPI0011F22D5F|nr:TRAP transporter substrate-binding protein [Treponema pectinovorum]
MKKSVLLIATACVLAITTIGCGKKAANSVTIKVGENWGSSHPMGRAIQQVFKAEVESKTNGAVKVDVYSDGTLGNEGDLWNGVRNGTIEMAIVGTPFNQEWPVSMISDWPFLYKDLEHAKKVWTGDIATDLNKQFHEKFPSVYMLAWGPNSARTFTSNKKLTSVADFVGQKFRMPSNPIHVGIAQNLGASAQVIPLGDLFSALESGVVDGQDNGMVTVISQSFDQVQKYIYETNHIIATLEIIISAGCFDKLTKEQQKIVSDAAKATTEWAWTEYIKSVDSDRASLKAKGLTITPCTAQDQALIQEKIKPLTDKLLKEQSWAKALTEKIKAY